jgi:hypothetical protein
MGTVDAYGATSLGGNYGITGTTLNLHGNTTWSGDTSNLVLADGAVVNNYGALTESGAANVNIPAPDYTAESEAFNNYGSLTKAGDGALTIAAAFNSSGPVSVTGGGLTVGRGGSPSTSTGSYTAAAVTLLEFWGPHDLSGPISGDALWFHTTGNAPQSGAEVFVRGAFSASPPPWSRTASAAWCTSSARSTRWAP